ncbi:hypothetical protein [Pantoea agglomerans]|uniref:hypothetical protein n=1 Tax=Enterobacter agglomerans TaxID=549 RepID=UPI00320AF785
MEITGNKSHTLPRFKVFGVLQFVLYMNAFAIFYWHNQTAISNPAWRSWSLIAVAFAVFVSFLPYYLHKLDSIVHPFLNVIVPVVLYLLFVAGYCFYTWSVPPVDDFLITFADFYLFGTAIITAVVFLLECL